MMFSIITVCFNERDAIAKTCKSVTDQTFTDYEWIVIDGGSTDGTLDILETYRPAMAHCVSERDNGIYDAMNKGIARASGRYLLFLNGGDTFFSPSTLEKVASVAQSTNADLLYGEMVDGTTGRDVLNLKGKAIDLDYFSRIYSLHHQATFIRADLFKRIGTYDPSYRIVGDYDWWLRYITQTATPDMVYLDDRISVFDMGGISMQLRNRLRLVGEAKRAVVRNIAAVRLPSGIRFMIYRNLYKAVIMDVVRVRILQFFGLFGLEAEFRRFYQDRLKQPFKRRVSALTRLVRPRKIS